MIEENETNLRLGPLYSSQSGGLTGEVYFDFSGNHFPEEGWIDFPVVIIGWWLEALHSASDTYEFHFMDGPFFLRFRKKRVFLLVEGVRRSTRGNKVILLANIDRKRLRKVVEDCAKNAIQKCGEMGINNDDVEHLREMLN